MPHIEKVHTKRPSSCNCTNIRRASHAVTQFYENVLQPSGLTIAQLALLRNAELVEQTNLSELAKMIRIDRTTLNRNMKPLVDAGLIVVNPGKDSRTRQVMLTDTGKEALKKGWVLWEEAQASIEEYLGGDELAKLVKLLSKLEALVP